MDKPTSSNVILPLEILTPTLWTGNTSVKPFWESIALLRSLSCFSNFLAFSRLPNSPFSISRFASTAALVSSNVDRSLFIINYH
jgi:hypothetical protein